MPTRHTIGKVSAPRMPSGGPFTRSGRYPLPMPVLKMSISKPRSQRAGQSHVLSPMISLRSPPGNVVTPPSNGIAGWARADRRAASPDRMIYINVFSFQTRNLPRRRMRSLGPEDKSHAKRSNGDQSIKAPRACLLVSRFRRAGRQPGHLGSSVAHSEKARSGG